MIFEQIKIYKLKLTCTHSSSTLPLPFRTGIIEEESRKRRVEEELNKSISNCVLDASKRALKLAEKK
ncbi:hypothetical protein BpHYR1_010137 [Brachionus plicatilis]|uniref:Uncharacterized protein n=1 Tax=Brachionus plicatilis TaxID=10195 RepID=A0A3M7R933_BRAPC|nr:hypothetical protein BpHYR1_010137 [Brachionus plicatilis]